MTTTVEGQEVVDPVSEETKEIVPIKDQDKSTHVGVSNIRPAGQNRPTRGFSLTPTRKLQQLKKTLDLNRF